MSVRVIVSNDVSWCHRHDVLNICFCVPEACWLGWRVSCRCAGGQGATSGDDLGAEPRDKIRHTMVTPGSHGELSYISSSLAASSREVPGVLAGMEFWLVRRWFWNSGHAGHAFCHNWTTAYYNVLYIIWIYIDIIYEIVSWAVDGGAAGVDFASVFFADSWYT